MAKINNGVQFLPDGGIKIFRNGKVVEIVPSEEQQIKELMRRNSRLSREDAIREIAIEDGRQLGESMERIKNMGTNSIKELCRVADKARIRIMEPYAERGQRSKQSYADKQRKATAKRNERAKAAIAAIQKRNQSLLGRGYAKQTSRLVTLLAETFEGKRWKESFILRAIRCKKSVLRR